MTATAFKTALDSSLDRMYRTALYLCGNRADAADAVQDACIRLWERRDQLDTVTNFAAYASMTVRNVCLDNIGKRKETAETDNDYADDTDIERDLETKDTVDLIISAMSRLPDKQRIVMTMRDIDGCDYDEIIDVTGLSGTNIRVLLSRARNTIREFFNK